MTTNKQVSFGVDSFYLIEAERLKFQIRVLAAWYLA
jgi:hypothetical protein